VSKLVLELFPQIPMSRLQRIVLAKLAERAPAIVPHSELLSLWQIPHRSRGSLDMVLFGLRKKLPEGYEIIPHRGVGYSLSRRP
jgi:hypothetical protein